MRAVLSQLFLLLLFLSSCCFWFMVFCYYCDSYHTTTSQSQRLKITQNVTFDFLTLAFSTNFYPITSDWMSGNTVWPQSPKLTILGIYNELLSTQNVNVARFARNGECDFFCDFQTPLICLIGLNHNFCSTLYFNIFSQFYHTFAKMIFTGCVLKFAPIILHF